jgi:hypothetical protein
MTGDGPGAARLLVVEDEQTILELLVRRKVDQGEPRLIHTIRGVGYVLRIPPP